MNKGIELNVNYEPYYGINVSVWVYKEEKDNREEFVKKLFEALKDEWVNKNVNIPEWLDFINTLSNGLNGDELYKNVVSNYIYIDELERKAYELGISLNCIHKNHHDYDRSESITIYDKLTPLLKNTEDFKQWFLRELHSKDERTYIILFDDEESKKSLICKLEKYIEREESSKKYHKQAIDEINKKINEYKKELKETTGD